MADVDALPPAAQEMLLKELRDLQMPDAVSWWPPAPGWWLVGAIAAAALVWAVWRWRQHREATRYRRDARNAFSDIHNSWTNSKDANVYLNDAAALLRQIAIKTRGREHVAGLTGSAWIAELSELSGAPLSSDTTAALTESRYRGVNDANIDRVHGELQNWLAQLKAAAHV